MRLYRLQFATAAFLLAMIASCAAPPPSPVPVTRPSGPAPSTAPGGAPAPAAPSGPLVLREEPSITVGLAWDRDTLLLTPVDELVAVRINWPGARDLPARGPVRLSVSGAGVKVENFRSSGWQILFVTAVRETAWLASVEREGITARWNDRQWRGALGVFVNPRGRLTLVARLPLETYLLGVVPGEIGALGDDRIEAGKAQSVAARSYTMFYRGRRAAEGFDLFASVEDQVYGPVESERPLATRCVIETRGVFALSDGQPIRANYCSTCGGMTAEVWEAWPTASLDYLVSHRDRGRGEDYCSGSTHYRWRETWSADEFMANLARFGPANGVVFPSSGLGDLVDASVDARSRSGRVWRLKVVTTTGVIFIPAYALRPVLRRGAQPGAILRSNLFKLAVRRDPESRRAMSVVASGAGSGHGVGLCQTGALGMARAGEKSNAILAHYYPGTEVKRLYP